MAGYGDDSGFASWLVGQGFTLPDGAPTPAVLRQRGSDYVDATYGPLLSCSEPTGGLEQERAWPRTGHKGVAPDVIPSAWVRASYRAAWLEATTLGWASGSIDPNRRVKRQKVDTIEREFFDSAATESGALGNVDAGIAGIVAPYLCAAADGVPLGIWSIG